MPRTFEFENTEPSRAQFTSIHTKKLHKKSRHNHSIKDFGGGEEVGISRKFRRHRTIIMDFTSTPHPINNPLQRTSEHNHTYN